MGIINQQGCTQGDSEVEISFVQQLAIIEPEVLDRFGVDTIEMGVAMGIAMEGGLIPWGDGKAAIDLLKKVGTDAPLGRIIGNGAAFTGQAFGVDRVPVVKR